MSIHPPSRRYRLSPAPDRMHGGRRALNLIGRERGRLKTFPCYGTEKASTGGVRPSAERLRSGGRRRRLRPLALCLRCLTQLLELHDRAAGAPAALGDLAAEDPDADTRLLRSDP